MRDFSFPNSLAGSLLLAHPNLLDPNFRRAVIFISAHDPEEGSFGLVLNRATGKTVADFLPDESMGTLAEAPVFVGGPVALDKLAFASFDWDDDAGAIICRTNLDIGEAQACAEEGVSVRAFVGYSGWGQQQIEAELKQRSWIVRPPIRSVIDVEKCGGLWPEMLRELGPWFRLMAAAPEDPSRN